MTTKLRKALLAVVLVVTVCAFSTVMLAHSHPDGKEHANCELCHLQHTGVLQPTAPAPAVLAFHVVRSVTEEQQPEIFTTLVIHSVPRAPPA